MPGLQLLQVFELLKENQQGGGEGGKYTTHTTNQIRVKGFWIGSIVSIMSLVVVQVFVVLVSWIVFSIGKILNVPIK